MRFLEYPITLREVFFLKISKTPQIGVFENVLKILSKNPFSFSHSIFLTFFHFFQTKIYLSLIVFIKFIKNYEKLNSQVFAWTLNIHGQNTPKHTLWKNNPKYFTFDIQEQLKAPANYQGTHLLKASKKFENLEFFYGHLEFFYGHPPTFFPHQVQRGNF